MIYITLYSYVIIIYISTLILYNFLDIQNINKILVSHGKDTKKI